MEQHIYPFDGFANIAFTLSQKRPSSWSLAGHSLAGHKGSGPVLLHLWHDLWHRHGRASSDASAEIEPFRPLGSKAASLVFYSACFW